VADDAREPPRGVKRVAFALVIGLVTFVVCTALVEAFVRRFIPQSSLRQRDLMFRYEPFVGAEGIPGIRGVFANRSFDTRIEHNSQGFRDREHAKSNTAGKFRIVVVGDSFTWGHGVNNDEIYMKVLEQIDDRVETINLGGPGGDPPGELKVYSRRGVEYQHDVVLLGFYIGNDVVTRRPRADGSPPDWGFDETGEFRLIGREAPADEVARIRAASEIRYSPGADRTITQQLGFWLRRNLQLLTLIDNRRDYLAELLMGSRAYAAIARRLGRGERHDFPLLDLCVDPPGQDVAYGWRLVEATLREFRRTARESGARLYVMMIPDMYQTWPSYYATTARRYGYDPQAYDLTRPNRKLRSICDALEIACLDLLPGMRESMDDGHRLYYRRDRHWTPEGHRLAARALRDDLERRGWLD